VPKPVTQKPFAATEVSPMLVAPSIIPDTGGAGGDHVTQNDVWI
jgi:hypothetical protein